MRFYLNFLLIGLALVALGLSVLAWKQHLELTELRAAALTNASRADWQKRVPASQQRAQGLENRVVNALPGGPATITAPMTSPAPVPRSPGGGTATSFTSLLERPEVAHLMAIQQKGQIDARYAALFKSLGLPADKLAQLKALLADKLSAPLDVLAAAGPQGVDPVRSPQEFNKLIQDTQAELDEKIKAVLAPTGYAQYQNYLQTEPQRAVVSQLQQSLSYSDAPISPAQAEQLVQILAATNPAPSTGALSSGAGSFGMGPVPPMGMGVAWGASAISDEAIARAQGVLSAPQIQALQEIQQQQQVATQLRQLLIENAGAGRRGRAPVPGPSGPTPPTPGPP